MATDQKEHIEEKKRVMNERFKNAKGCNQYGHADDCKQTTVKKPDRRLEQQQLNDKAVEDLPPNPYIPKQYDKPDRLPEYADDELIDAFMEASVMAADGEDRYAIWLQTGVDVGMTPRDIECLRLIKEGVSSEEFYRRTGQRMSAFKAGLSYIGKVKQMDRMAERPRGALSKFGKRLAEQERSALVEAEFENRHRSAFFPGKFNRALEWQRIQRARAIQQVNPHESWLHCYTVACMQLKESRQKANDNNS